MRFRIDKRVCLFFYFNPPNRRATEFGCLMTRFRSWLSCNSSTQLHINKRHALLNTTLFSCVIISVDKHETLCNFIVSPSCFVCVRACARRAGRLETVSHFLCLVLFFFLARVLHVGTKLSRFYFHSFIFLVPKNCRSTFLLWQSKGFVRAGSLSRGKRRARAHVCVVLML